MGLLDDAIREHLDLKRRRGADPTEVQRDEREALGPVRRAPEATAQAEAADEPEAEPDSAYDHEDDGESWSHEDAMLAEPEPSSRPAPAPAPAPEPEPRAPGAGPDHASVAPTEHPAGGETGEYDVEPELDSHSPAKPVEREDVLEETPEFLQDTPDHDRLWFEQRPPKDFDFEG